MRKTTRRRARLPQVHVEALEQPVQARQLLLPREVLGERHEADLVIGVDPLPRGGEQDGRVVVDPLRPPRSPRRVVVVVAGQQPGARALLPVEKLVDERRVGVIARRQGPPATDVRHERGLGPDEEVRRDPPAQPRRAGAGSATFPRSRSCGDRCSAGPAPCGRTEPSGRASPPRLARPARFSTGRRRGATGPSRTRRRSRRTGMRWPTCPWGPPHRPDGRPAARP